MTPDNDEPDARCLDNFQRHVGCPYCMTSHSETQFLRSNSSKCLAEQNKTCHLHTGNESFPVRCAQYVPQVIYCWYGCGTPAGQLSANLLTVIRVNTHGLHWAILSKNMCPGFHQQRIADQKPNKFPASLHMEIVVPKLNTKGVGGRKGAGDSCSFVRDFWRRGLFFVSAVQIFGSQYPLNSSNWRFETNNPFLYFASPAHRVQQFHK